MNSHYFEWFECDPINKKQKSGPYKVEGDALSLYRVCCLLTARDNIRGEVHRMDGQEFDRDEFFTEALAIIDQQAKDEIVRALAKDRLPRNGMIQKSGRYRKPKSQF